ncbi:hypothetical protein, partial [Sphingobium sp.]|uniref:hypothetical protein n=1 Tax=Sphingobium sp. TaxID=1912891 RepID=UPI00257FE761
ATANGSQNSPTGAATYRPSKLTPTGLRNRRATAFQVAATAGTNRLRKKASQWSSSPRIPIPSTSLVAILESPMPLQGKLLFPQPAKVDRS